MSLDFKSVNALVQVSFQSCMPDPFLVKLVSGAAKKIKLPMGGSSNWIFPLPSVCVCYLSSGSSEVWAIELLKQLFTCLLESFEEPTRFPSLPRKYSQV